MEAFKRVASRLRWPPCLPLSCASSRRWYCSTGYFESMGSQTGCFLAACPAGEWRTPPARRCPARSLRCVAYWSDVSTLSMMAPNCISPQVPRVFTLVITRFKSPTLPARVCISPRPLCTCSSRSLTSLKDSPRRCSSVAWSFSSTVRRISSSLVALSAWMAARRSLSAVRSCSAFCCAALHHAQASCCETASCSTENWLLDLKAVGFELVFEGSRHRAQRAGEFGAKAAQRLALGRVQRSQPLRQLHLERTERRQQLGAAGARLIHGLGQLLVHRLAHRLQAVAGRLGEALQLVGHAVERAVVLGDLHAGRLALLLQPLKLREQFGRQLDARLAQQRDELQRRDEDRSDKEDQEMGVRHGAWLKSRRHQSQGHEGRILQYL
jgi:hypothetical protein